MKTKLAVLDLFSGIGGFAKGLHEASNDKYEFETISFCEIDKKCHSVLSKHYPSVPIFDDVTLLSKELLEERGIPKIDYIVGGFPCFIAGTQVLTKSGYQEIDKIKVGTKVLTHDGNWKTVTGVSKKVCYEPLYKIRASNKCTITCTGNHPFYVQGKKWVQAKDLNKHLHRLGSVDLPNEGKERFEDIEPYLHYSKMEHYELLDIVDNRDSKKFIDEFLKNRDIAISSYVEENILILLNVIRRETGFAPKVAEARGYYQLLKNNDKMKWQRSYVREGNITWSDILKIEVTNRDGEYPNTVYNLNVEDDESYVVYDIIVHNCQDISVGGKKRGFYDEHGNRTRSGLWEEYRRLIGEIKPKGVIIENVENLRELGLSTVLNDLTSLGYDSEWGVFTARDTANLPHQRQRLYIVSYPSGQRLDDNSREERLLQAYEKRKNKNSKEEWEGCESKPLSFRSIFSKRSVDDFRSTYPNAHSIVSGVHRVTHGIPNSLHKGDYTKRKQDSCKEHLTNLGASFSSEGIELAGVVFPKVVLANKSYCIVDVGVEVAIEVPHTTQTEATLYEQVELACILHGACVEIEDLAQAIGVDEFDLIDFMQVASEDKREARIKQLGNSIVPQIAKYIGERILDAKQSNR